MPAKKLVAQMATDYSTSLEHTGPDTICFTCASALLNKLFTHSGQMTQLCPRMRVRLEQSQLLRRICTYV